MRTDTDNQTKNKLVSNYTDQLNWPSGGQSKDKNYRTFVLFYCGNGVFWLVLRVFDIFFEKKKAGQM